MQILTRSLAAVALVATAAAAQTKTPDFSGEWTLNAAKSDFGGAPAPPSVSATVVKAGAGLTLTQTIGAQTVTQPIPIGPRDSTWTAPDGLPATSSTTWSGDTLVVNTKLQRQGMDITLVSRWSLSPDGQVLTMGQQSTTPMGAMKVTMVFDRKS